MTRIIQSSYENSKVSGKSKLVLGPTPALACFHRGRLFASTKQRSEHLFGSTNLLNDLIDDGFLQPKTSTAMRGAAKKEALHLKLEY